VPRPGRIEDDDIWTVSNLPEGVFHFAWDKLHIINSIALGIFSGIFHCVRIFFDSPDLSGLCRQGRVMVAIPQ
jgi:hypothetical protein